MEKLYYSISEVADILNINQSKLRFWEREFKQLSPRRNAKGTRFYTAEDIETVKKIIFLKTQHNLKLEGAKKKLSERAETIDKQQKLVEKLKKLRVDLRALSNQLSQ